MRSICTINPAITEIAECVIIKVHARLLILKWVYCFNKVYHYASFSFQLFERLVNIPSKK